MLVAVETNVPLDLAAEVADVDAFILAESALLECSILLTSDAHLRAVDHERLPLLLRAAHVASPIIATPREIVRKFFR